MKAKEIKEVRGLSIDKLQEKLQGLKKDIARIKTIIREKETNV